ncbi:D-alanine--D-alanine ligase [bioreactor metagenome]|uniref:D-alanine--D-alanine ligase n=1 Tax=bioreactor metagenome TaxID=1076179 RepID=A0A644T7X0_9ZZZZ|nr:ATP-grasp domain-containing protein [Methanobrevibacter sp.]MEA4957425.1 ATP-grasp domain-containing protein [Methanobrevibacter sp.]
MKILFIGARLFDDVDFYLKEKNIESVLTESNPKASNLNLADKYFIVPRGMEEPIEIAKKENVDGIISLIGIDDPLMDVAIAKEYVESKLKIPFIASNTYTVSISSDKIKTKEFFIDNDIDTSRFKVLNSFDFDQSINELKTSQNFVENNCNLENNKLNLPLVLKQRSGQGGRDICVAKNMEDVNEYFSNFDEVLCEEFIEGSEISIEVLCFKNEYIPLVPVYKGETSLDGTHPLNKTRCAPANIVDLDNNYVKKIAYKIAEKLKAEGTIDIDFIFSKNDKKLYALEINTRPSGTRYLTAASTGINPLNKLVDMVSGDFSFINKQIKNYFALEIPIGSFNGKKSDEYPKKFTENSWVVHGPSNYERLTISGESKEKTMNLAKELLGENFHDYNLNIL